jgi:hypothetical protein
MMVASYGPVITTDGLILCLDAANPRSYPGSGTSWFDISGQNNHFTLFNSPTFGSGGFTFNGTNQYAASAANINLTTFDSVTVIIAFRSTNSSVQSLVLEHTVSWNSQPGGFGFGVHSNGDVNVVNSLTTNHFSPSQNSVARNYNFVQNNDWSVHTNIWTRIADPAGRLTYVNNNNLQPFVDGPATTGTGNATTNGLFANAVMYLCCRGGTTGFSPLQVGYLMMYNRKLSAAEVQQHFDALRGRFAI